MRYTTYTIYNFNFSRESTGRILKSFELIIIIDNAYSF